MSLREKTLLSIGIFLAGTVALLVLGSRQLFLRDYEDLELEITQNNLDRVDATLQADLDSMSSTLGDWSYWTDTWEFVRGDFPDFIDENIVASTYVSLNINGMVILDIEGDPVFVQGFDDATRATGELEPLLSEYLLSNSNYYFVDNLRPRQDTVVGYVTTDNGTYMLASRAILRSDLSGEVAGTLIWARLLTAERVQSLSQRTGLPLQLFADGASVSPEIGADLIRTSPENPRFINRSQSNLISGNLLITSLEDERVAVLRFEDDRSILNNGQATVSTFILYFVAAAIAVSLAILIGVNRMVVYRVTTLSDELDRISSTHAPLPEVTVQGRDEIARLAFGINKTLIAQRDAESALQANRQHLQTIIDSAPVIVFAVDRSNTLILMEGRALNDVGLNPARLVGRPIEQVIQSPVYDLDAYKRALRGETVKVTVSINHRILDMIYTPIRDQSGREVLGITGVAVDVTERASVEDALRRARDAAVQANHMKSTFLASMSHELRTPLNAILNFTQFVSSGMLGDINEEQEDFLLRVVDSGKHLLNLINDILDISKIEAGAFKLSVKEHVEFERVIKPVIETAEGLLADHSVELKLDIDDELPQLTIDPRRVRQILLNLVSNACKFTEHGHVKITARRAGSDIFVGVHDTGPGIPLDDQELIFETFHQTRTGIREGSGTGLGLAISRRLAEAHGGALWVESTPGKGSSFFLRLPVRSRLLVALAEQGKKQVTEETDG